MFRKLWKYVAIGLGALVCAGLGAAFGSKINISWGGSADIGAVELATVVLAAVSVILVVLTIFLAALGFVGLATINNRLKDHSRNYFDENLKKGKPAFAMVEEVVREVLYSGVDSIDAVDDNGNLSDSEGETNG